MARSNIVVRRFTDNGEQFDVFVCQAETCGKEFSRPTMRGVKPLFCPDCAPTVVKPRPEPRNESRQDDSEAKGPGMHAKFPTLLAYMKAGIGSPYPVQPFMYGPAGSGKTFAARAAAKELGMDFRTESCSLGGTEVDFFGFIGANDYNRTAFRDVWEHGGVFLFDEMDAASPYVLTKINAALAAGIGETIEFPDASVPRHPNTILVGAGNTNMRGGDANYHTRQPADAALPTRFAFIDWDYDEAFERTLVAPEFGYWVDKVQGYRRAIRETRAEGVHATPRATITGAALLGAGISIREVEAAVLWQGASDDTIRTIKQYARSNG